MCGRFTLTATPQALTEAFAGYAVPDKTPIRYNIAPSQPVAVITNTNEKRLDFFVWGLVPAWAKDPKIGNRLINARAETLGEKPSFKNAYKRRRCLVLADGFYEWQKKPGSKTKTPMYIRLASGRPFAFAGLWEQWHAPDGGEMLSCTIITTEPNELLRPIHNRMPVILLPDAYSAWLNPAEQKPGDLSHLLKPYPAVAMAAYPVSTLVNNPRHDGPECIAPQQTLF